MVTDTAVTPTARVKAKAIELGFSHVGIAAASPLGEEAEHLREWLARGYHAGMAWMDRAPERRVDPRRVVEGARSIVAVAMNYYTDIPHSKAPGTGKISRYAWGDDYHNLVTVKLEQLSAWLVAEFPGAQGKLYVDTGPVMEKVWAQRAGIGWEGKHTNLITRNRGSWVFLGEVITTLELDPDEPATDHCGTCTLCIDACPTAAIVQPYVVDSNLCLSYLTIEHRGEITGEVTGQFEHWIYGCDICQDVCPWNHKFAVPTVEEGFAPRDGNAAPVLAEWVDMTNDEFVRRFKGSPVKRTKHEGLVRNVKIAGGGQSGA